MTGVPVIYLNGRSRSVPGPGMRLLDWLRECEDQTDPKEGCGAGQCGGCTVLLDGQPVLPCCMLAARAIGRSIWTATGLAKAGTGRILRDKFAEHGAFQCGFCAPGVMAAGVAWLNSIEFHCASRHEASMALSGNLCRCTGYVQMIDALVDAAEFLGGVVR